MANGIFRGAFRQMSFAPDEAASTFSDGLRAARLLDRDVGDMDVALLSESARQRVIEQCGPEHVVVIGGLLGMVCHFNPLGMPRPPLDFAMTFGALVGMTDKELKKRICEGFDGRRFIDPVVILSAKEVLGRPQDLADIREARRKISWSATLNPLREPPSVRTII